MADDVREFQHDLGQQISAVLAERASSIVADAVQIFPFGSVQTLDRQDCVHIGMLLLHLLTRSVRDGRLDADSDLLAALHRLLQERSLQLERLFAFAYLVERAALDELALHQAIGVTTEPWPLAVQLVRRASFDMLAACAERARLDAVGASIIDPLTTLHTRPLFDAVLSAELDRASRFGYSVSLILFDVDHLSALNEEHGVGVGDKLLRRLGVLIRGFFRQQDWVARYGGDRFAVLLTGTDSRHAAELAERVRTTVQDRLEFTDYRSGRPVPIAVTAAVVSRKVAAGDSVDPERLVADAEVALRRQREIRPRRQGS